MRPLLWGTIWFVIGMIGWVTFSVICGVELGLTGECSGVLRALVYLFGIVFFFSLPVSVLVEIIQFVTKRRQKV